MLTPPPIDGVFAIENHPLRLSQQTMSLRLVTLLIQGNSGRESRRLRGTYLTHLVLVDEAGARQLIRSKLREGLLPRTRAVEMVVVRAAGQPCDGCGEPIAKRGDGLERRVPELAGPPLPCGVLRNLGPGACGTRPSVTPNGAEYTSLAPMDRLLLTITRL